MDDVNREEIIERACKINTVTILRQAKFNQISDLIAKFRHFRLSSKIQMHYKENIIMSKACFFGQNRDNLMYTYHIHKHLMQT